MTVRVPEGRHEVSLQFQNTWWRTGAVAHFRPGGRDDDSSRDVEEDLNIWGT